MLKVNSSKEFQLSFILCRLAIANCTRLHGQLPVEKILSLLDSNNWKQSSTDKKIELLKEQYEVNESFTCMINKVLTLSNDRV